MYYLLGWYFSGLTINAFVVCFAWSTVVKYFNVEFWRVFEHRLIFLYPHETILLYIHAHIEKDKDYSALNNERQSPFRELETEKKYADRDVKPFSITLLSFSSSFPLPPHHKMEDIRFLYSLHVPLTVTCLFLTLSSFNLLEEFLYCTMFEMHHNKI